MSETTSQNYGADWRSSIAAIESEALRARARLKNKLRAKLRREQSETSRVLGMLENPSFPWRPFEPSGPKTEQEIPDPAIPNPDTSSPSTARRAAIAVAYIWLGYSLFRVGMMIAATAMAGGVPTATGSDDLICLASVLAGCWFLRPK